MRRAADRATRRADGDAVFLFERDVGVIRFSGILESRNGTRS